MELLDQNTNEFQGHQVIFTDKIVISVNENGEKQINDIIIRESIGRGGFSKVKKAILKTDEREYVFAAKIVNKRSLYKQRAVRYEAEGKMKMINNLTKIYEEIDTWRTLYHKNIGCLYEVLDDDNVDKMYMIMEYADLGQIMAYNTDLQTYTRNRKILDFMLNSLGIIKPDTRSNNENTSKVAFGILPFINPLYLKSSSISIKEVEEAYHHHIETIAKRFFYQLTQAIQYLHYNNIIHRDIKPDNILLSSQDGGTIKLIDFTVSRRLKDENEIVYDCEGTPFFTSPEVSFCLKEGYKPKPADIWSLGICLYTFMSEKLPFNGESDIEIQIKCKEQEPEYEKFFSVELIDLLRKMLKKCPDERPTASEILVHPWFKCEYSLKKW